MGEVWMGRHRMLARPAAVKLIRPDLLGNDPRSRETAVRRFEREATGDGARSARRTRSTSTTSASPRTGAFFYVMEFLEGLNLDTMVQRFGPIGAVARRFTCCARPAIRSARRTRAGLIHRDIKPANIFSCRLGPDCDFVKVLDFGLVKHTGS